MIFYANHLDERGSNACGLALEGLIIGILGIISITIGKAII